MRRSDKLTEQQELERRKRIPLRTQKTLGDMIRRRFAELCEPAARPQPVSLRPQQVLSRPQQVPLRPQQVSLHPQNAAPPHKT
jgi:hypothetical protein